MTAPQGMGADEKSRASTLYFLLFLLVVSFTTLTIISNSEKQIQITYAALFGGAFGSWQGIVQSLGKSTSLLLVGWAFASRSAPT